MRHLFTVAAAALALAACASRPPPPPDVSLYAIDCGRGVIDDAGIFADDGAYDRQERALVVPCYLIRHPSGDLLWDAGVPEEIHDAPNSTVRSGGFTLTVERKLTDQLAQLAMTPADIEFFSISHSHFDHIGNGGKFAASTWIVDADERAYAFRDEARADAQQFAAYAALETAPTVLIEGDGDYDVFGDGSVRILQTPGHTPGHTVLLVNLPQAGPVLLTGDMYHMAESRAARRVPRFNVNRDQTLASMDRIEAIASETGARVIRQHVPEDFVSLPTFPQALR